MLATLSLTVLIMLFGGYALSLGFFAGMLSIFLCSFTTICLFMHRMKKQLKNNIPSSVGFKKSFRNTIVQAIDIHFVNLLIAIGFIFMGSLDLNTMGICIGLGTLISVILNLVL
jgi:hypothetical protein